MGAEADPWYYYTHGAAAYHPYTYGYGYPYYQYVLPTVKAAEEKAEEPVVEAKAAEVKPVVYTHPYYYGGYGYPYAYNYAPVAHAVVKPYTYYANSGGAVHIVKKREAEPEAEADPNAWYGWIRIQTILGIRIQICLLSSILIRIPWILWRIPWILLRKIDCCNTNTGCGYLKKTTNHQQNVDISKHITILNYV